jgi:hypothetical protein
MKYLLTIIILYFYVVDWEDIQSATAVPTDFQVQFYDTSWHMKCQGVKFRFTKAGAGAVTFTNGNLV